MQKRPDDRSPGLHLKLLASDQDSFYRLSAGRERREVNGLCFLPSELPLFAC